MKFITTFLIAFVAFEHFYFMILEMFYWTKPKGMKAFGHSKEIAEDSKSLAANMGLYNGFLSAGLIWSIIDKTYGNNIAIFFLSCVIIAGVFGAYSTKMMKLFYIQSIPAILAMIALLFLMF